MYETTTAKAMFAAFADWESKEDAAYDEPPPPPTPTNAAQIQERKA